VGKAWRRTRPRLCVPHIVGPVRPRSDGRHATGADADPARRHMSAERRPQLCRNTHQQFIFAIFAHVFHSDCMAFSLGFSLLVRSHLRSKPFLRSPLASRELISTSGWRADRSPLDFSLQSALTLPKKSPFARSRPPTGGPIQSPSIGTGVKEVVTKVGRVLGKFPQPLPTCNRNLKPLRQAFEAQLASSVTVPSPVTQGG
jgi:hypothetical protein